jgi:TolA-binding protein
MAQETKDLFQQVLGRISDLPGGESVVHGLNNMRERLDDMQKRILGLDAIEQRVAALERRLDELTEQERKPARRAAAKASGGPAAPKKASPGADRTGAALKRSAGAREQARRSGNA